MSEQKPAIPEIRINGIRPLALRKEDLVNIFGNWPKIVDRMLWASRNGDPWLEFVSNREGLPGRQTRVSTASAERAFARILAEEEPPLMPSEKGAVKSKKKLIRLKEIAHVDPAVAAFLESIQTLPKDVESITLSRENKSATLQYKDGRWCYFRLARPLPGKPRRYTFLEFASHDQAIGPLDDPISGWGDEAES